MGRKKKEVAAMENHEQQSEAAPEEYPFLRTPAVQGGVILDVEDDYEVERVMTPEDIDAAHEQMYFAAQQLREAESEEKRLFQQEKQEEAALKGTREALRKAEAQQLALGRELATYSEEIKTGVRTTTTRAVVTLTAQNEIVFTDGKTGEELLRRTATAEEIEEANQKQAELGPHVSTPPGVNTPDSPDAKPELQVRISINLAAYKKAKKGTREGLQDVAFPNSSDDDPELFPVIWTQAGERSAAVVPTWAAHRLKLVADVDKALDFQIEQITDTPTTVTDGEHATA